MDERYAKWSKTRRFEAAEDKVLDGWTQKEAAERYGVTRQQLNKRMKKRREVEAGKLDAAKAKIDSDSANINRAKSEGQPTPAEFFERYFGGWVCPDCNVHHELPDFHSEIWEAIRNPDNRRVLVNIPPYHSKSTLISVWDTVYDICMDRDSRTIIVSKSKEFAETFVRQIQEILTNEELYANSEGNLIEEWGPFKPEGQSTWNQSEFIVSGRSRAEKDPTVLALGFGSQIYGRRADKIKFDDVATLTNSSNPERVMGMLEWIDKEALSRIGKSGIAIWVGTRVSAGDIYLTLGRREGYKVIRYPALMDDRAQKVLWPEHFPYEQVLLHKAEMRPADFQLVYQNIDIPGAGASFTEEMMEDAKDVTRVRGHYNPSWRLIGGVDLAGGTKGSGYSAFTLLGIDLNTGKRYLVDQVAVKSMKAPQIKEQMLKWTAEFPIYEWRVENNGLQSQIIQYDTEIIQKLARMGVRVQPHSTQANKWDDQFGVESMATMFHANMVSIPWGNSQSQIAFEGTIAEFIGFPMSQTSDRVMSWWFADLGLRELEKRQHLPLFDDGMKVPARIRRKRRVIDFAEQSVSHVGLSDQRAGHLTRGDRFRRMTVGQPTDHKAVEEFEAEEPDRPMNVDPRIWNP